MLSPYSFPQIGIASAVTAQCSQTAVGLSRLTCTVVAVFINGQGAEGLERQRLHGHTQGYPYILRKILFAGVLSLFILKEKDTLLLLFIIYPVA